MTDAGCSVLPADYCDSAETSECPIRLVDGTEEDDDYDTGYMRDSEWTQRSADADAAAAADEGDGDCYDAACARMPVEERLEKKTRKLYPILNGGEWIVRCVPTTSCSAVVPPNTALEMWRCCF